MTAEYGSTCPCGIDCDIDFATRGIEPRQDGTETVQELPHTSFSKTYGQFEEKQFQQRESEEAVTGIRAPHSTSRGEHYFPREVCTSTTKADAVIAEKEEVADTTASLIIRDPAKGTPYDPVKAQFDRIKHLACAMSTPITDEGLKMGNALGHWFSMNPLEIHYLIQSRTWLARGNGSCLVI